MGEYGIATKTIKAKQTFTSTRKRDLHEEKLVKEHKENSTLFLGAELLDSLVIPTKYLPLPTSFIFLLSFLSGPVLGSNY